MGQGAGLTVGCAGVSLTQNEHTVRDGYGSGCMAPANAPGHVQHSQTTGSVAKDLRNSSSMRLQTATRRNTRRKKDAL